MTLLGLITTLEGPTVTERQYSYGVFNDSEVVEAIFRPEVILSRPDDGAYDGGPSFRPPS